MQHALYGATERACTISWSQVAAARTEAGTLCCDEGSLQPCMIGCALSCPDCCCIWLVAVICGMRHTARCLGLLQKMMSDSKRGISKEEPHGPLAGGLLAMAYLAWFVANRDRRCPATVSRRHDQHTDPELVQVSSRAGFKISLRAARFLRLILPANKALSLRRSKQASKPRCPMHAFTWKRDLCWDFRQGC